MHGILTRNNVSIHMPVGKYICKETFYVPFQTQSIGVDDQSLGQWLDFTVEINRSKEVTSCQWIRTRYCNSDIAWNLWSYCVVERNGEGNGLYPGIPE